MIMCYLKPSTRAPFSALGDFNHAGSSLGLREASPPGSWALKKAADQPRHEIQRMKIHIIRDVEGWGMISQFCGVVDRDSYSFRITSSAPTSHSF